MSHIDLLTYLQIFLPPIYIYVHVRHHMHVSHVCHVLTHLRVFRPPIYIRTCTSPYGCHICMSHTDPSASIFLPHYMFTYICMYMYVTICMSHVCHVLTPLRVFCPPIYVRTCTSLYMCDICMSHTDPCASTFLPPICVRTCASP